MSNAACCMQVAIEKHRGEVKFNLMYPQNISSYIFMEIILLKICDLLPQNEC